MPTWERGEGSVGGEDTGLHDADEARRLHASPAPPTMSIRPGINRDFLAPDLDVAQMQARFTADTRDVYLHRHAIVAALGARAGETVVDLGAGTGVFSELLARAVGPAGTVYALDPAPAFVAQLQQLAAAQQLPNLAARQCSMQATGLAAGTADRALLCDTYHHLEYPHEMLLDLREVLRPGGELLVVDFERIPGVSRDFILEHVRADKATVVAELRAAGFELHEECALGLFENYALRCSRS